MRIRNRVRTISRADSHSVAKGTIALLLILAMTKLVLHFVTNIWGGYGYFRDELYYIACSEHLDIGYVDHPPFSIWMLAASRWLLGDSLFALRLLPALAGAGTVFFTGWMARELGGGRFSLVIASLASIVSLINLAMGTFFSMNSFDILLWTLSAYILIRLIKTGAPRYWPLLGLALGVGLLNKTGVLWLGVGIFAGLLLTLQRAWLKTKWPWITAAIAGGLFLPYILWNITHDFAHLEFIRNTSGGKYSSLSYVTFITGQVLVQNPITLPIWVAGVVFYFFGKEGKTFRLLGVTYLSAFLILVLNQHSKAEYLSPAYGFLFAGGGVAIEGFLSKRFLRWLKPVYGFLLIAGGLLLAPLTLPILPVETYIEYAETLGVAPSTFENKELGKLPQFYADMFGWEEKAAAVANVFNTLSTEEQSRCAIFADNYGRCAAIDFFGKWHNLPRSVGRHNNYWIWGPGEYTGDLVLVLGGNLEDKRDIFERVEVVAKVNCAYCMPYENNLVVYLCRNLKIPIQELWPRLKHYD